MNPLGCVGKCINRKGIFGSSCCNLGSNIISGVFVGKKGCGIIRNEEFLVRAD